MAAPGYIPGSLVIPATVQMRLLWQLPNGRAVTNVLHGIVPDGFAANQFIADGLYNNLSTSTNAAAYFAFLASTTALQAVDVRDLRVASQGLWQSTGAATPGTGVGNPLPEEVALVVTLRTELAGRAHRGRMYLPGFDDSALDAEGHATGGLTAAAQAWANDFLAAMSGLSIDLGVGHRGHDAYTNAKGQPVAAEAPGTDRVTSIVVRDNIFDSQRRRK